MTAAKTGVDINDFRRYIEGALAYSGGTHTFEDVCEMVVAGTLQFWPGVDSAIVTEIINTPRQRSLHFFLAGGNLAELEAMVPGVCDWGREQGCTVAGLTGRRGWERTFLARTGWAPTLVLFEKKL